MISDEQKTETTETPSEPVETRVDEHTGTQVEAPADMDANRDTECEDAPVKTDADTKTDTEAAVEDNDTPIEEQVSQVDADTRVYSDEYDADAEDAEYVLVNTQAGTHEKVGTIEKHDGYIIAQTATVGIRFEVESDGRLSNDFYRIKTA